MKRPLLFLLTCAALGPLAGCAASYSHTDIGQVSTSELPANVGPFKVQVTHGGIVKAHIAPFNSDGKPMVGDVQSADTSKLVVWHSYGDKDYVFVGVRTGKTTVALLADGAVVATIEAEVTEQP